MVDDSNSLVFSNRYRFEPVGSDWDRGRSGCTQPVYDLRKKRLGVIKRAEVTSKEAVAGLKNEIKALRRLKKYGVPRVYETGEAIYDSKKYFYMVIEYIDGIRVERNVDGLSGAERVAILAQLFQLLAEAHRRGIANGDVDLKHLFWLRESARLVVIDWGNARLGINPRKRTEFAFDLARSAEIVFSLVTRQSHPPSAGSIALPEGATPAPRLPPVPGALRELCAWAPRTPSTVTVAPYTTAELMKVSKGWLESLYGRKHYRSARRRAIWLYGAMTLIVIVALAFLFGKFIQPQILGESEAVSSTSALTETSLPIPDAPTLAEILVPQVTPTGTALGEISSPAYSPILTFDDKLLPLDIRKCWKNEIEPPSAFNQSEGLYRSYENGKESWWRFSLDSARTSEGYIQTDFKSCLGDKRVAAVGLNAWVTRIEPEKQDTPGNEFGFFMESQDGERREYTLWIDQDERMHLRIREGQNNSQDYQVLVAGIQHGASEGDVYDQFLLQIFLELDNHGSDILYLLEGANRAIRAGDMNPSQMVRIDGAVRPALANIQKIGLIGRGGKMDVRILPLFFFETSSQ